MRLINADKLKEDIKENGCDRFESWDKMLTLAEYETFFCDEIDNAPTVEQRQKGEWIRTEHDIKEEHPATARWYKCSACKQYNPVNKIFNYCPNCGADMREDAEA